MMNTVLVYECYADAGCPASDSDIFYYVEDVDGAASWAITEGWRLTRSTGLLVEADGFTEVAAYEYEDYMSVVYGDYVWVGTTAATAAIYECVDAEYCTYITPSEDWTGEIWAPTQGQATDTEFEAANFVEALPWWVYAWNADFWALPAGT